MNCHFEKSIERDTGRQWRKKLGGREGEREKK